MVLSSTETELSYLGAHLESLNILSLLVAIVRSARNKTGQ